MKQSSPINYSELMDTVREEKAATPPVTRGSGPIWGYSPRNPNRRGITGNSHQQQ